MSYNQQQQAQQQQQQQRQVHQQRLNDLLEAVKQEFDYAYNEASNFKVYRDEYELKFSQQTAEMQQIRQTVYELEMAHRKIKEAYEDEILRLKNELDQRDRRQQAQHQQVQHQQQAQQQQQQQPANGDNRTLQPLNIPPPPQQKFNYGQTQQLPPPQPQPPQQQTPKLAQTATQPVQAPTVQETAPAAPPQQTTPKVEKEQTVAGTPAVATPSGAVVAANSSNSLEIVSSSGLVLTEPDAYQVSKMLRTNHLKPLPPYLQDLDGSRAHANYRKTKDDYYILYNPSFQRNLDVDLVHSIDHSSVVCCVRFSKDGKFLATGCNKTTQVFGVETGELVAKLVDESTGTDEGTTTGDLYIRSVCFSPDGKFLATGAEDKLIRIWDLSTRKITKVLRGHEQDIYSLDFFPDGNRLVSGSGDRTVRIWDIRSAQCSLTLSIEDGVTTVAVSPDGKLIAAGSLDRTVRVWDASTGFLIERLDSENEQGNGHRDSVYSVAFSSDGQQIASGSLDRTVKLWNLEALNQQQSNSKVNSSCEVTYVGHKDFVLSVCSTPNGEYILSGSKDRGVIFWDKLSGNSILMLQGHRNSVISVSVANNSVGNVGMFATGSGDCKARIWRWTKN